MFAEANACGTPVPACPLGAAPEVVDDGRTGILCDVADMADAVADVAGIAPADCRTWAAERYSSDAMVDGHESLFQELARR